MCEHQSAILDDTISVSITCKQNHAFFNTDWWLCYYCPVSTMKGKTIINKISDGCSLLFKQWHVTVSLACIVPRTSIQTHNSETMMEISCVCEWLILLPPMQWKKDGTRSCLQKVFGKSWWWDFFWGGCNVINNLLFYQFPVCFYWLFCL